jgi:PIN domain nuclease of toxin-antitoxin system
VLLWAVSNSPRLSNKARALINSREIKTFFSVVSLWEIAIKADRNRPDFVVHAETVRLKVLANGGAELPVLGSHVIYTSKLPAIHKDPFDRLLVAQALLEGLSLITCDATLASYLSAIVQV